MKAYSVIRFREGPLVHNSRATVEDVVVRGVELLGPTVGGTVGGSSVGGGNVFAGKLGMLLNMFHFPTLCSGFVSKDCVGEDLRGVRRAVGRSLTFADELIVQHA